MGDLRFRTRPMPPSARAQPRTYYRRAGSAFWGWHPVSTRPKRGPSIKEKKMRSEEHTSELESLMRNSYDVFCLNKTKYSNIFFHSQRKQKQHVKTAEDVKRA